MAGSSFDNLTGLVIKAWDDVFAYAAVEQLREVSWGKFPCSRNGQTFLEMMACREGRDAFCVFVGVWRLVTRYKAAGICHVRGRWITAEDIIRDTALPRKVVIDGFVYLRDVSQWLAIAPKSILDRFKIDPASIPTTKPSFSLSDSGSDSSEGGPGETPAMPPEIDTPAFRAKWDEWLAYRRERGLGRYTPRSVTAKLKACASWGEVLAIQAIDAAIEQGWQGFFRPKGAPDGRGKQRGSGAADRRAEKAGREYDEGTLKLPIHR